MAAVRNLHSKTSLFLHSHKLSSCEQYCQYKRRCICDRSCIHNSVNGNESTIYSANESNLEDIKTELNEMVIEYRNAMVFKCRNGMVFEEKLLSEELYYYSRIEDKISVYMEKVKVNFTTVNLKEVH